VGIYLRQSYAPNGDILAVSRQRTDVRKLCGERGWTDTVEYVDNDFSATSGKRRPAYQDMLADIRDGTITAVAVWDLDRLYRQPRALEDFIDLADEQHLVLAGLGDRGRRPQHRQRPPVRPD
jgi:DNA invertase Pin-like site-specific DNA recombinase